MFFFQAEDGIRDLVRSRGLGDVYKRQKPWSSIDEYGFLASLLLTDSLSKNELINMHMLETVSYTHLTLPTSDLV